MYLRKMSREKNVVFLSHTYIPRGEDSVLILKNILTDQVGEYVS